MTSTPPPSAANSLRGSQLSFVGIGVMAEAIYQMEKGSLRTVLSKAVYAAYQRAVALGRKQ
jgi:hypothetical protein